MTSVKQITREVLNTSTLADPGLIAAEVLRRIPADSYGDALREVLRPFVRQLFSEGRTKQAPAAIPMTGKSWKVAGVRVYWQRHLRSRIHVGDAQWKLLRDCTYEDLIFAADERRLQAERNAAQARQYDAWARLMTEHDVERFGDLPFEVLLGVLSDAA